jgi:hypothetical protein
MIPAKLQFQYTSKVSVRINLDHPQTLQKWNSSRLKAVSNFDKGSTSKSDAECNISSSHRHTWIINPWDLPFTLVVMCIQYICHQVVCLVIERASLQESISDVLAHALLLELCVRYSLRSKI